MKILVRKNDGYRIHEFKNIRYETDSNSFHMRNDDYDDIIIVFENNTIAKHVLNSLFANDKYNLTEINCYITYVEEIKTESI